MGFLFFFFSDRIFSDFFRFFGLKSMYYVGSFTVCTGWVTGSIPPEVLEPGNKISSGGCCAQLLLCLKTGKDIFFSTYKNHFYVLFFVSSLRYIFSFFQGFFQKCISTRCAVPC